MWDYKMSWLCKQYGNVNGYLISTPNLIPVSVSVIVSWCVFLFIFVSFQKKITTFKNLYKNWEDDLHAEVLKLSWFWLVSYTRNCFEWHFTFESFEWQFTCHLSDILHLNHECKLFMFLDTGQTLTGLQTGCVQTHYLLWHHSAISQTWCVQRR